MDNIKTMNDIKRKFQLILIFILLTTLSAHGQSLTASVNNTTVGLNEPFLVTFQFNGTEISSIRNFHAPDFKNFKVLSGPNQSQSMQIINGAISASLSFSFYVQGSDLGSFTIGQASLDFKGKTLKSQPLKINVVKGQPSSKGGNSQQPSVSASQNIGENVFIRASADRQKVLKGEQVTITYKLYTRMDIASPQISKLPSYQGFWAEELEAIKTINFTTEVVNGKQFRVAVLKKAALFPTQTGQLSVTPFELKIPVIVPKQRKRGDIFDEFFNDPFFNQGQTVELNAKSNTLKIDVLPLPGENVPKSFKGAVGDYSFKALLDKSNVKTNEPFTIKMVVSGTGNISLLEIPEISLPGGFEKYEPKTNAQVNRSGNVISGQKTVEYLIVPRITGQKEIQPVEFSYFNPKTHKYNTISSEVFRLNIEKGEGNSETASAGFNKEDVKLLGEDIRFIKTNTNGISHGETYLLSTWWFWVVTFLPFGALMALIILKKRNDQLNENVQLMKYRRAEKMARNRLKAAKKYLEEKNQNGFYTEISFALSGYLEDKLHIAKSEFSVDYAVDSLRRNHIPEDLTIEVGQALDHCEFARFAPLNNASLEMQTMYEKAVKIIIELERQKTRH
ncbi:MAG: BatD family protein [Methanococcaceae archaeon]